MSAYPPAPAVPPVEPEAPPGARGGGVTDQLPEQLTLDLDTCDGLTFAEWVESLPKGVGETRRGLGQQFGADHGTLAAPDVGDPSAASLRVDGDHVADGRELAVGADVLAGADGAVGLDECDLVGLGLGHRPEHRRERGDLPADPFERPAA
jgi:hypothetical protein